MKIYYSKYIGYGSLAFACALFVHLSFLSVLRGFKNHFCHYIQIYFIVNCDLCSHWDQRLTSRQIAFELTSDGIMLISDLTKISLSPRMI